MDYFSKEEIAAVKKALSDISGVSIDLHSYKTQDEQLRTFFDKAKLWRVIERIISALYIRRLLERKMFLHDSEGNDCLVVTREEWEGK